MVTVQGIHYKTLQNELYKRYIKVLHNKKRTGFT
jgi:hypothetical protein